jgi:ElaB/YqjD/DUF883 family membrane-anchored ribosome-binding protein
MEATEHANSEKFDIRAKLEAATEKAKVVCRNLQQETATALKAADELVREHPYQTAGLAFGVGVLIGVLAARGRHD